MRSLITKSNINNNNNIITSSSTNKLLINRYDLVCSWVNTQWRDAVRWSGRDLIFNIHQSYGFFTPRENIQRGNLKRRSVSSGRSGRSERHQHTRLFILLHFPLPSSVRGLSDVWWPDALHDGSYLWCWQMMTGSFSRRGRVHTICPTQRGIHSGRVFLGCRVKVPVLLRAVLNNGQTSFVYLKALVCACKAASGYTAIQKITKAAFIESKNTVILWNIIAFYFYF